MTPLGLSPNECEHSLTRYADELDALTRDHAGHALPAAYWERLDELLFRLEVEVRSRAGREGARRMTAVEAENFLPALRKLWALADALEQSVLHRSPPPMR